MNENLIRSSVECQKDFFSTGATLPVRARVEKLKKLYSEIKERKDEIAEALFFDLGKSEYESFMCEIGLSLSEISYLLKNVKKLARPKRARTPLAQFPSKSYMLKSPYGTTLIMSPWNYPFLLSIEPLADSIAAGNTAILKPSAYAPNTSKILSSIVSNVFPEEWVKVIEGGRKENAALLDESFDFIFFTGSTSVGREVLRHAAENLTPTVLELGGKSPCIVDSTAKIRLAARRIVFGKFLNCGQTCVAPDYILCHESVRDELTTAIIAEITAQLGDDPITGKDYGKIINEKHFDRLLSLIDKEKVIVGGAYDRERLKIAPTVMQNVSLDDAVMGEEIFGPILPIITYKEEGEILSVIESFGKPLALYVFTESREFSKKITESVRFGGGCINDTIIHLATSSMPFGGVGESGMGAYHGKAGFDAFSHTKSIVKKSSKIDLPMRYRPYKKGYRRLLDKFLK
ncbi:MAG: aldehyde dehydrogenase [Clostridia bacterium]|nr:aldehyde dehydrogenase [Clostridia bacterium]